MCSTGLTYSRICNFFFSEAPPNIQLAPGQAPGLSTSACAHCCLLGRPQVCSRCLWASTLVMPLGCVSFFHSFCCLTVVWMFFVVQPFRFCLTTLGLGFWPFGLFRG